MSYINSEAEPADRLIIDTKEWGQMDYEVSESKCAFPG